MTRTRIIIGVLAGIAVAATSPERAHGALGDLFVQVGFNASSDPNDPNTPGSEGCSIVRVQPNGTVSEWVSNLSLIHI